jgi:hypothetical protein
MKSLTYPRFYFDGNYEALGGIKSDRQFILDRMAHIPPEKQHEISLRYEVIYRSAGPDNRQKANEFLHETACHYREEKKNYVRSDTEL